MVWNFRSAHIEIHWNLPGGKHFNVCRSGYWLSTIVTRTKQLKYLVVIHQNQNCNSLFTWTYCYDLSQERMWFYVHYCSLQQWINILCNLIIAWAEVARWRNGLVLRYLIIAIPTQRSWVRDWVWEIFHLFFFESYVLEMRLTAFLCRLQTEMSSKEWFGSHYKL